MEKTITFTEILPPYTRMKDQNEENYVNITLEELKAAFKEFTNVIVLIPNSHFTMHHIQPRVVTYTKKGRVSKTETQKKAWYRDYKMFFYDMFKRGYLFKHIK